MKKYDPQIAVPTLKAFFYGDPGSGKTTLISSAMFDARTAPLLMLTCAGNPESIRRQTPLPTIVELEATKDLNVVYDWLLKGQPAEHAFVRDVLGTAPDKPFRSIALDTITEYQRIAMDEITGNVGRKLGDDLKFAERRDWGQALARITQVARWLFRLNMSVFITAQERREVEEATGTMSYEPSLWGGAAREVPGYSLLTMRLVRRANMSMADRKDMTPEVKKQSEAARTTAFIDQMGRFLAKEQYGGLPPVMTEPTVAKLMTAIYG